MSVFLNMFLQVDYNGFSYTWMLEYIFYQKNILLCASWRNICFLPDEYTSLCKLTKMVMNSTSNLHVSSLGGVMRNYKMSSLHGSTSRQKSSWRAWECIQQGRKTIVQDSVVSWKTVANSGIFWTYQLESPCTWRFATWTKTVTSKDSNINRKLRSNIDG